MCEYSPRFDGSCVKYYDPLDDAYYAISCKSCKGHMDANIPVAQLHHIQFICDEETVVEPFMRVCYRYRNWYGDNDEYVFESSLDVHCDFMKLCMDSKDIHNPVVYEATVMYEGLSEEGNPNWIIIGDIKMVEKLHPYWRQHPCEHRGLDLCEGCGICSSKDNPFESIMFEETIDKWISINMEFIRKMDELKSNEGGENIEDIEKALEIMGF